MKAKVKKLVRRIKFHLLGDPKLKAIQHGPLFLPTFRNNQGLDNDEDYVASSKEQIDHLKNHFHFHSEAVILDFGCGQGRFANGLKSLEIPFKSYFGVDTILISIKWCKKWLTKYGKQYNFIHLPAHNARYNLEATQLRPLPFEETSFDLIFLNSVFSHMLTDDIVFYLSEFYRTLKPDGKLYVTAFIEDNVESEVENPEGYLGESKGKLHRVRFNKDYFFSLYEQAGFTIEVYSHRHISRTNQSVVIAKK